MDALQRQAEQVIAEGSKSFAAAAKLYRPAMRRDVMLLYAWCRHCDDVTDGQTYGRGQCAQADQARIGQLKADSIAAARGEPAADFPFQALGDVAKRHHLPEAVIRDHIRGFELDGQGWRPNTEEELLEYCYFVAGAVGILMARIMGVQQSEVLLRACDLGLAFQLTNIARDVVEDARAQRYYLPQHWLNEQGLQADDLTNTDCSERIYPLVCRLVQMAEPYYQSANIGIRALPGRAAWAIATARAVYRDIGLQLLAQPSTVIQQRSYTRRSRKVWRITTGALQVAGGRMLSHRSVRNSALWTPRSLNEWA